MESTILLFTNVCVSEITAINMSLTKEDIIKGLKEVTRKLEEGDEIDSSTMGIVEKFLKNFPPPTTRSARNLSEFPAELLQLIFFYLPLCDLKSAVLVCKRWKGVAENSKLWEDKKLVLEEGENMTLSCAVEVARRRKIQTIQAIGLSSDQVKKVAMGMKGYPGLKELDLGGGSFGHVGHSRRFLSNFKWPEDPLNLVEIKNPFGSFQTNPKADAWWVPPFFFLKKLFL